MSEYEVRFAPHIRDRLAEQGNHAMRTIQRMTEPFEEDPYPSEDGVNQDELPFGAGDWYWQRIGRAWLIFYLVDEETKEVRVADVERASEARPKYDV